MGAWMDLYVKHDGQSFKLQISFKAEAMMIYMYHLCFWSLLDPNATQTPPNTKFAISVPFHFLFHFELMVA